MEMEVKSYYEKEASEYDKEFYKDRKQYPILQYRHHYILKRIGELSFSNNANVLDIGCGPGEMVIDLSEKYDWNIWGIDIAENMIKLAKEKTHAVKPQNDRIHFSVGDIENLNFSNNSFDLIICSGVIEYLSGDEKWSNEITRVLKPGGILLVNVTNKYCIRNWTSDLIDELKKNKVIFSVMNFVKQKILRKEKLHYFPFKPRLHSPQKFDEYLVSKGFEKLAHNYFGFFILPAPFDTLLSFITNPIRKRLEKYSERNMKKTGNGYLVCAKLSTKSIEAL